MEEYLSTLTNDWKKIVKRDEATNSVYHFVGGKELKAIRNVTTPLVAIGNKQYMMMSIDVVKNDIL